MQVILQEKIKNLGAIGEIVDVKPGFARNDLFRSGKALPANKDNVARVMERKSELEKIEKQKLEEAKKRVALIEKLTSVDLAVPTNEEGKLFGSIGAAEIVDILHSNNLDVSKQEVSILEMPVRVIGQYTIVVQAHADASAKIQLNLTSSTVSELAEAKKTDQDQKSESAAQADSDEAAEQQDADGDAPLSSDDA